MPGSRIAPAQKAPGPEVESAALSDVEGKAPAAICRKVAEVEDGPSTGSGQGGTIEVWGDGTAIRAYTYVDDLVEGVYTLMQSDLEGPTIIGGDEYVTVAEVVQTVIDVSGKDIHIEYVEGPVGVHSRNFSKARIKSLGWEAETSLREGIRRTYTWIEQQVIDAGSRD